MKTSTVVRAASGIGSRPSSPRSSNINEGDFWWALKGEVRKLQEELAGLDLEKMLATDPADDGETGEDGD